ELHKLWDVAKAVGKQLRCRSACMGDETAGGLSVTQASQEREVLGMVGDGSYLMTNSEMAFFFRAGDGIRDKLVTGVQTCALPILIPVAQHCNLLADLSLEGTRCRRRIPRFQQRRDLRFEPWLVAVVRSGDKAVEREVLPVLQHADRVEAARILAAALDVGRKVRFLRAVGTGRRPRVVVRVVEPSAL